jgi:hypothetical protein
MWMLNFPRLAMALLALVLPFPHAWAQQLNCQPCNNHYGRITIGSSAQRLIQFTNIGTKSVRIRTKSVTGNTFTFGNFALPIDVGAGKSIKVPVIFSPTVVRKSTAAITLTTSNAQYPKFVINVYGEGVAPVKPHLVLSPASLDFGSVTVGSSSTLAITLSATVAPVTISAAQSNSSEFTLPGIVLPLTIAVGQNVPVKVKFKPSLSGRASAQLTLTSNADNSPTTVALTGLGVAAGAHSADLTWSPSRDTVIGYNVYRGANTGGPYSKINPVLDALTSYTDSNVKGGITYYFVVTAVNALNQESAHSNEVKVAIPTP